MGAAVMTDVAEPVIPDTVPDPKPKRAAPAFDPIAEYGDFEGRPVVGVVTKINGTSSQITRQIHPGELVYTLTVSRHTATEHKTTKEGWKRHQTLGAENMYELTVEAGSALERELRAALKAAGKLDDPNLLDEIPKIDVKVDESGVAILPSERGDGPTVAGEPWDGYDKLTASKAAEAVAAVQYVDVALAVIDYENASRHRSAVISAARKRANELKATDDGD